MLYSLCLLFMIKCRLPLNANARMQIYMVTPREDAVSFEEFCANAMLEPRKIFHASIPMLAFGFVSRGAACSSLELCSWSRSRLGGFLNPYVQVVVTAWQPMCGRQLRAIDPMTGVVGLDERLRPTFNLQAPPHDWSNSFRSRFG